MDYKELQQKIDYARDISKPLPPLPVQDIPELLQQRSDNESNYLTYIDENDNRTEVSCAEFYQHVINCARFLQNRGLSHGDRIATISHNHWHTVVQYFAAWLLGLVVVPINLGEDDERIAYILENGEVELAFVRTEYRERFRGILESYKYLKNVEWIVCEGEIEKGDLELPADSLGDCLDCVYLRYDRSPKRGGAESA